MCDDDIHPGLVEDSRLSRRGFGLLTVAGASLAAAPALAQSNVVEKDVAVKTPDGTSDCALFYPTGTGATMKELGEGSRDIIISTTGWDINPRALGIVPKEAKIQTLKGFHWVSDAFFMTVPKGLSVDKMGVLLDVMAFILTPKIQAFTYDEGYLYPGPAVKNVPLDLAPQKSQDVIKEFGRPEYAGLIANNPIELPLTPDKMVVAFRIWDEKVGAKRKK